MPKLKIIHAADIHFDNDADILQEVITCSGFMAAHAEKIRPHAIVIAGDLTDQRLLMDSPGALAALGFVRRLSAVCPVLVVKGTELHDFDNLEALRGLPNVMAVNDARQVFFKKDLGFYQPDGQIPDAVFSCLPSLSKAFLVSLGTDANTAEEQVVNLAGDVMRGWGVVNDQMHENGVVTVLVGHGTITGAITSTGQAMLGRDLTYGTADLRAACADYIAFGHIHKSQRVGPAWYSGSIGRLNAGELEPKGFFVVDLEPGKEPDPQFVQTPAREFVIIDLGKDPENWKEDIRSSLSGKDISGNVVIKVKAIMSETNAKNLVRTEVEGVVGKEIIFDKKIIPVQRTRAEGISKLSTAKEKYIKWAESAGQRADEEVLARVEMLDLPQDELLATIAKRFNSEVTAAEEVREPVIQETSAPAPGKVTRKKKTKVADKQPELAMG